MKYTLNNIIQDGKTKYWAYGLIFAKSKENRTALKLKPTLGVVYKKMFYPIKKDGTISNKGRDAWKLSFTETQTEAINQYNALLDIRINDLKKQLNELELQKI